MSHMHRYILVLAENEDDAKSEVNIWLDDYAGKEFFDYGGTDLEGKTEIIPLSKIRDDLLGDKLDILENRLPEIDKEIEQYRQLGYKGQEGYAHIRYGEILCECVCTEMPFYNIEHWDWTIPEEDTEDGKTWYAVMVDFHY